MQKLYSLDTIVTLRIPAYYLNILTGSFLMQVKPRGAATNIINVEVISSNFKPEPITMK